jgi:hypothetical protein
MNCHAWQMMHASKSARESEQLRAGRGKAGSGCCGRRPGQGYTTRIYDKGYGKGAAQDDLEICRCASYLRSLIAIGFVMTFLSSSLAFGWWRGVGDYGTEAGPSVSCCSV